MDEDLELNNLLNNINNYNNLLNFKILNILRRGKNFPTRNRIRTRVDPMNEFNDRDFKNRFRFYKNEVQYIYNSIDGPNTLEPMVIRSHFTLPGMTKLLIALRFYAVGAFYQVVGDMFGVSTYVVCKTVMEVSYLIATKLRNQYIKMPDSPQELLDAKTLFMRMSGFPICIAAVDGTHIAIQSYGGDSAEVYRNRKMFFSHNCQLAVSADVRDFNFFRIW